ncbi:alpha/beta fold hydrolase [Archangium gephyra]|uniref:alpha/beta fold hydrolase n=1 Tax=Archangium gephyra TaxID=48 RepID=UPI003B7E8CF6
MRLRTSGLAGEGHVGVLPPRIARRQVEVEGVRAQVLEAGEGPVLLLLASMLVRARSYLPLIRRLSAHFRVLTVELPGSGRSAAVRKPWTLAALLRWAPRVRMPVLLAWGRRDHTMPLSCAERLRERLPHARVYVGAGSHDWLITDSREFTRAVLAFAGGPGV